MNHLKKSAAILTIAAAMTSTTAMAMPTASPASDAGVAAVTAVKAVKESKSARVARLERELAAAQGTLAAATSAQSDAAAAVKSTKATLDSLTKEAKKSKAYAKKNARTINSATAAYNKARQAAEKAGRTVEKAKSAVTRVQRELAVARAALNGEYLAPKATLIGSECAMGVDKDHYVRTDVWKLTGGVYTYAKDARHPFVSAIAPVRVVKSSVTAYSKQWAPASFAEVQYAFGTTSANATQHPFAVSGDVPSTVYTFDECMSDAGIKEA